MKDKTGIKVLLVEKGQKLKGGHILITVPGKLKEKIMARKIDLDLSALKMVVYDEADELFIQEANHEFYQ